MEWGKNDLINGIMRQALIVASFPNDCGMEIANVVFVDFDEILYPVPRSLYTLGPLQREYMSKSQYHKMTTVLPEDSVVTVQINPATSKVSFMMKGGAGLFGLEKRGSDWVMEVDVAVSDEKHRQAFVCSSHLTGTLMKTAVDLNSYEPNKPYKGIAKLRVFYENVMDWAHKGIHYFLYWQRHFKEADRKCFEFSLISIYETDEPNISVVYEAPWQSVKRSVVLTPAQVGDVSYDELKLLASMRDVGPPAMAKIVDNKRGKKAGPSVTSVYSEENEGKLQQQQKDFVPNRPTDDSFRPLTEILSAGSIKQIMDTLSGVPSQKA